MKKYFVLFGMTLFILWMCKNQTVYAVDNGLFFDGVDDYVNVGDIDIQTALTVEAWVKPTSLAANKILGKHNDQTNVQASLGIWTTGKYSFEMTVGGTYYILQSKTVATLNQYTYLAGTYDGSQINFYVNGVLQESKPASGTIANQNLQMTIGKLHAATEINKFKGNIYEVRLWKKAKTQQELIDKMNVTLTGGETGLVANWVLTPQTTGIVYDRSPNHYNGTVVGKEDNAKLRVKSKNAQHIQLIWNEINGMTDFTLKRNGTVIYTGASLSYDDTSVTNGQSYTYEVIGKNTWGETMKSTLITDARSSSYVDFSGGKKYIKLPNTNLDLATTGTIETCFSINGTNNELYQMLLDHFGLGVQGYGYALFIETASGRLHARFGDSWAQGIPVVLNNGKMHCVSMTHSPANGMKVYVNGTEVFTVAPSTVSATKNAPFYIGRRNVGPDAYQLNGKIYDVRIWNLERTASDIAATYNQPLTGNESGLLAYYKMDGIFQNKVWDTTVQANHGDAYGFNFNQQKIGVGLIGGELTITYPQLLTNFSNLTLNGKVQKLYASYNGFTINDTTGTANGWSLNVKATPFKEVGGLGYTLPSGSLLLYPPSVITPGNGNDSLSPTVDYNNPWAIDSGNSYTIIKAFPFEGMGEFIFTLPVNTLELTLFPSTTKIDKGTYPNVPTPYESTVTWMIAAGP